MEHGNINDKPVLAVDCSTTTASIALAVGDKVHRCEVAHGRQAADLVPTIDGLMKEYGVAYEGLGCILTTIGPGSFTGLRIALATVHGLALAHAIPVKAITSLQSIANTVDAPSFHVALNAGKGKWFVQEFYRRDGKAEAGGEIMLLKPESLPAGTITDRVPDAAALCHMADALPVVPLAQVLPLYIRPPDAKPGALPPWLQ
jgi:tRNA threonylcarbamoyladenosine biosynthesis protein TsaB